MSSRISNTGGYIREYAFVAAIAQRPFMNTHDERESAG